jgi:hypothetical protein
VTRTLRLLGQLASMLLTIALMSVPSVWAQAPDEASDSAEPAGEEAPGEVALPVVEEPPAPVIVEEPEVEPPAPAAPAFEPMDPDDSVANEADRGDLVVFDGGMAQVALYGLVSAHAAAYTGADNLLQSGDVAEQPGFRLRYGRFGLHGWAFGNLEFMVSMETADLKVRPLDAWLSYRPFDVLAVTVGAHKVPFSRYATTGSANGSLLERPLSVNAMSPYRQMGVTLHGAIGDGLASYAIGVYNGLDRHTNFHEGYVENAVFEGNRFNKIAFAGRLSLEPFGGVGADIADLDGGGFRLGVGTSVLHNEGATTRATAWSADLILKVYGFHLISEYISDTSEPVEDPTTPQTIPTQVDRSGLIVGMGYMILPGQLGLAVRGEMFDDDANVDNNGDQVVVTGGLQYYWHRHHFKVSVDYTHREELYGAALDNDALLLSAHFAL